MIAAGEATDAHLSDLPDAPMVCQSALGPLLSADELQRRYRKRRRLWARKIGAPYLHDKPEPGELPLADEEEG